MDAAVRLNYAIVLVSDMSRSVAFYRDVIGLPLRFESPHWSELEAGGATIALHLGDGHPDAPDPDGKMVAGRCRLGLRVDDLTAFHHRMTHAGVPCVQQPKVVFGAAVAQYLDPDGLAFSVGEGRS